jgi:hypothetical protein
LIITILRGQRRRCGEPLIRAKLGRRRHRQHPRADETGADCAAVFAVEQFRVSGNHMSGYLGIEPRHHRRRAHPLHEEFAGIVTGFQQSVRVLLGLKMEHTTEHAEETGSEHPRETVRLRREHHRRCPRWQRRGSLVIQRVDRAA